MAVESGIKRGEFPESPEHQAGAGDKHDRESNLNQHQRLAESELRAFNDAAGVRFHCGLRLDARSPPGGRDAEQEAGENQKAAATLERLNYIYPEDEDLHRRLGDLLLAQNKIPGAIREYQAVLAMKPLDQASAHYELAKALKVAQRPDDAREQVLEALEAAPIVSIEVDLFERARSRSDG